MKRLSLSLLLCALACGAHAQLSIRTDREGGNVTFRVEEKERPGTATVLLTLSDLRNCKYPAGTTRCYVQQAGQPLLMLRPVNPEQPIGYRFSYIYYDHWIGPKVDTAFVYRMPCTAGRSVHVGLSPYITDCYSEPEEELRTAGISFYLMQGDTIYAMRRGTVTRIRRPENHEIRKGQTFSTESFGIWVEHPDGSLARYSPVDGGHIFVEEGDEVLPSTPLSLAGTYDGERFHTSVTIGWMTFVPGSDDNGNPKVEWRPFIPRLATTEGNVWPRDQHRYTPAVTDELIRREMTRREIKRMTGNKK